MSKPLNYSKWDNLDLSDDEELSASANAPRVREVDASRPVTITPEGWTQLAAPKIITNSSSGLNVAKNASALLSLDDLMAKGGELCEKKLPKPFRLFFAQTKITVTINILVPIDSRAHDFTMGITVAPEDAKSPVSLTPYHSGHLLTVKHNPTSAALLDGPLFQKVIVNEHDPGFWVWELVDFDKEHRLVRIELTKETLPQGMVAWWKGVTRGAGEVTLPAPNDRVQNFQETWDEAHRLFREKVKNNKNNKVEI